MDCLVITITVQTTEKDNNVQEHLQQTVNLTDTLGLHRRYHGSLLVIDETVHVCRVQFGSCRSGRSYCTARHQGC